MALDQIMRAQAQEVTTSAPIYAAKVTRIVSPTEIYVVAPTYSDFEYGPAKLAGPQNLVVGSECLLQFDSDNEPWIHQRQARLSDGTPVFVGPSPPSDTSVLWVDTDDFDNDTDARLDALEAKLNPDFDSGWLADNNLTNGVRTYTHNLGLLGPPNSFKLWFSPDQLIWYPVGENRGMGTNEMAASTAANYHNPGLVSVSANIVEVSVYVPVGGGGSTSMPIYSGYTGTGWRNYASGYWRYKIWR